jgi:indole-3-glycerol phosphate synthase
MVFSQRWFVVSALVFQCFLIVHDGYRVQFSSLPALKGKTWGFQKLSPLRYYDSDYLEKIVRMKQVEVDNLLRRHNNDSIFVRVNYLAVDPHNNVSQMIRKDGFGKDNLHKMSIMIDMKRASPTVPQQRNIVDYPDAPKFAELMAQLGADGIFVNTDESYYGGNFNEFEKCSRAIRRAVPAAPPPCIFKDIIIHPVQVGEFPRFGFLI